MKMLYEEILSHGYSKAPDNHKVIISEMEKAEIFHIQNVADYYLASEQEYWDIRNDFPNFAPPFPSFWMEYKIPQIMRINKDEMDTIPQELVGGIIGTLWSAKLTNDDIPGTKWIITIVLFVKATNTIIQPVQWLLGVNDKGNISYFPDGHLAFIEGYTKGFDFLKTASVDNGNVGFGSQLHPSLLAVSFLHCKNIHIVSNSPIKGNRHNRHQPRIIYKTLEIEPMKKILREEGQSKSTGLKCALHICRGHFKDYTKGAGLFGIYKDVFWWESQVRGSSEQGMVFKDYNVNTLVNEETN